MPNATHAQNTQLDELLLEDGEEFIGAAYQALLKRRPDATGGRGYLRALQRGTSKLQILYDLSVSDDCVKAGGDIAGLKEAFLRDRIGEKIEVPVVVPPEEVAQVKGVEQLLALEDAGKLIDVAYWVLLKRQVDPDGLANYLAKLGDGTSKIQFLHELFTSSERLNTGVELSGLRGVFAEEGLEVADEVVPVLPAPTLEAAKSFEELIACQGGHFIDCAFLTLLKREPDTQERQQRMAQLLSGISKIQILCEIVASAGAGGTASAIPGLSAAVDRFRWAQMPVLGKLIRRFVDVEGNSIAEVRGRIAEQRLLILETEFDEKIGQLGQRLGEIAVTEAKVLALRKDMEEQTASLEKSVAALRHLLMLSGSPALASRSLSSERISPESKGRLELDLRTEEIVRDLRRVQ